MGSAFASWAAGLIGIGALLAGVELAIEWLTTATQSDGPAE